MPLTQHEIDLFNHIVAKEIDSPYTSSICCRDNCCAERTAPYRVAMDWSSLQGVGPGGSPRIRIGADRLGMRPADAARAKKGKIHCHRWR
ncbi:hypothetical protein [Neorhizobium galegae]|uniref:Uncharacterized protein n=1 Tax=Neorhizobium galegae bv. orientalis str. HAMBI 540 TaxID=1028800 RepID=A0A068SZY1_NEOGA|nr:Hypothetical protein RG540_PA06930 [Neorhizobium galegae bv. orientalis str. HAMBI 540]CDZ49658.1 Hypothetical protein NGAL_HAMBI2427_32750 [Neorhizobium galegae bv. orientalis]